MTPAQRRAAVARMEQGALILEQRSVDCDRMVLRLEGTDDPRRAQYESIGRQLAVAAAAIRAAALAVDRTGRVGEHLRNVNAWLANFQRGRVESYRVADLSQDVRDVVRGGARVIGETIGGAAGAIGAGVGQGFAAMISELFKSPMAVVIVAAGVYWMFGRKR